jgi:anti-anti-sigma regulatory factor
VKAPLATITPLRKLTLPEGLDSVVAATLAEALNNCRGENVVIDASYVRWLGADTLQVLLSAALKRKADGRQLTLTNGPANFIEDLKYFGVEPRYFC